MRSLPLAMAALAFALAGAAMAQQPSATSTTSTPSMQAPAGADRAEVLADLQMWQRAGMPHLADRELGLQSAEYLQGLERYRQLRAGPAFREAVDRLEQQRALTRHQAGLP